MNRHVITAFIMLSTITLIGCGPKVIDAESTTVKQGRGIYYDGEPFTGIVEEKNHEGRVIASGEILEGRPHGITRHFFASDDLGKKGLKEEFTYRYIASEKPKIVKVGSHTAYHESSIPKLTAFYNEQGKREGEYTEFCEDGTIRLKVNYINGLGNGPAELWRCSKPGQPRIARYKVNLLNGFLEGEYEEYYRSGEPKETGQYQNHKRDGIWKTYGYYNGNVTTEEYIAKEKLPNQHLTSTLKKAIQQDDIETLRFYHKKEKFNPNDRIILQKERIHLSMMPNQDLQGGAEEPDDNYDMEDIKITEFTYPLFLAEQELFDALIEMGADPAVKNQEGKNLLEACMLNIINSSCSQEHALKLVNQHRLSLRKDSDIDPIAWALKVNIQEYDTETSSYTTSPKRLSDLNELLNFMKKSGLDFSKADHHGNTLLLTSITQSYHEHLFDFSLTACDVNQANNEGFTPIHYILNTGIKSLTDLDKDTLNKLLDAGADINKPMSDGQTFKDYALNKGSIHLYEFIEKLEEQSNQEKSSDI